MQRQLFFVASLAVRVFYRREAFGERVPAAGPTIVVANHPNGLVDAVLLADVVGRRVRLLAKAPLFEIPVLGRLVRALDVLPVYRAQDGADTARNAATFEAVFDALDERELVCLFPEGRSHSEPDVQQLKTGAARMALGAEARRGFALGVRIVPVGLLYRARRRFRSRVGACVGPPIAVDDLAELHARDEPAAVRALTERIAAGLRAVTLALNRWEELPLIEFAAAVARPREAERLTYLHEFAGRVHAARALEPERVATLTDRVVALRERLACLGLGPENVHAHYSPTGVARFVGRNLGALLLVPPALAGALVWAVPYLSAPLVPRRLGAARDVHATIQLLGGLLLFSLWWGLLGLVAGHYGGWQVALLTWLASPLLGLAALALVDWRHERADDVRAFLILGRRRRLREHLVRERDSIAGEIEALRRQLADAEDRGAEESSE